MAIRVSDTSVVRARSGRYRRPDPEPMLRAEAFAIWSVCRAEANLAYDCWRLAPGSETFAVYRAAEDRADAAQDDLALLSF